GGAALSLRARRLPAARAPQSDARPHDQRGGPDPGRAVRGAVTPYVGLRTRARLGVRQDKLGDDGAPIPEGRASTPGRRCDRARHPRARARRARLLPAAPARVRRQDARAISGAAPHRGTAAGTRIERTRDISGALRLRRPWDGRLRRWRWGGWLGSD